MTRVYRRDDVNRRRGGSWPRSDTQPLPIEGIAWDGRDLVLVAEGGGFYRLSEKTWRAAPGRASRSPSRRASGSRRRRQGWKRSDGRGARRRDRGGWVIGLSIAYALAREGIRPTVLDRRELGREASWAGAGLIPPDRRAIARGSRWSRCGRGARGSTRAGRPRCGKRRASTSAIAAPAASTSPGPSAKTRAAGRGRPLAGRGDRLRTAAARRLRAGRAGAEPRAQGRLLPARPGPGPQSRGCSGP